MGEYKSKWLIKILEGKTVGERALFMIRVAHATNSRAKRKEAERASNREKKKKRRGS